MANRINRKVTRKICNGCTIRIEFSRPNGLWFMFDLETRGRVVFQRFSTFVEACNTLTFLSKTPVL